MKKIISLLLTAVMLAGFVFAVPASAADSTTELTSIEVAKAIGYGWNLGNTMEACGSWINSSSVTNYETAWGAPVTTKEMFAGLKDYGFGAVRIPVAWSNLMSTDGKYTINAELLARVDEIVGYVLDSGLYAIVNIHWDGGWWDDFGGSAAKSKAAMKKYKAIWTQLANHYKDYSNKLIFESANEELNDFTMSEDNGYKKTNEINQTFVDIVRASGGVNEKRYLLIAGYETSIEKTCDERFVMPTDTIADHLMISVHYYTPSTYCIADTESNSWGYQASWGTDSEKVDMWNQLSMMQKFTEAGYGVIIGEYGVAKAKTSSGNATKVGTDKFIDSVLSICTQLGYVPVLWDIGNTENNWYDRRTGEFADESVGAVFEKYSTKKAQKITNVYATYSRIFTDGKTIQLSPKASGNGTISYKTSDETIATVSSKGKVTLKGIGVAVITVTAKAKGSYRATERYITIVSKPGKPTISSLTTTAGKVKLKITRGAAAISGMEVSYSTKSTMSNAVSNAVTFAPGNAAKYTLNTVSGLTSGQKYYFRVRYFVESNGTKYYSSWSKIKYITAK